MTITDDAEIIREQHRRGSPLWARKRQQADAEAAAERARDEDRVRRRLPNPFQPPELTPEQLEARQQAVEQAKDHATRRRQFRSEVETELRQLDHDLTAAAGALDADGFCALHTRRVALLALLERLDTESQRANRMAPATTMAGLQRR